MPSFDFACSRGHVFEDSTSRETREVMCPCGRAASRLLSAPQIITQRATTPKSQRPLKYGQVQEAAQEVEHHWQKLESEMGTPLKRPDYFGAANRKAQDVLAGKTAPPKGWSDPLNAR